MFILGYWFGDTVYDIIEAGESRMRYVWLAVLICIAAYFVYRHLRKPVVEGSPRDMPPGIGQVTNTVEKTVEKTLETVKDRILHHGEGKSGILPPQAGPAAAANGPVPPHPPEVPGAGAAPAKAENGTPEQNHGSAAHPSPAERSQQENS